MIKQYFKSPIYLWSYAFIILHVACLDNPNPLKYYRASNSHNNLKGMSGATTTSGTSIVTIICLYLDLCVYWCVLARVCDSLSRTLARLLFYFFFLCVFLSAFLCVFLNAFLCMFELKYQQRIIFNNKTWHEKTSNVKKVF